MTGYGTPSGMHITKLRLLGFKSFVEPTELVIEKGLTGVVGPNGCGKSNLLEALRWVMGETSLQIDARRSSMDDVDFFRHQHAARARNVAEVTMFRRQLRQRQAPAEFNGDRRASKSLAGIERDMPLRLPHQFGKETSEPATSKILFEDAATGARSPALVRQGQIGEIVNAKPEQRRRILEDAAGIAGLHTRRHEAELRLESSGSQHRTRLNDVLGQMASASRKA